MLCALCTAFLLDKTWASPRSSSRRHHHTFSDLRKAANAGCKICWQVSGFLTTIPRNADVAASGPLPITCSLRESDFGLFFMEFRLGEAKMRFELQAWESEAGKAKADAEKVHSQAKADVQDNPWRVRHCGSKSDHPSSTSDPAVASLANRWLSDCQKDHKHCGSSKPTVYPKRLVDLANGEPVLIETGNCKLRDPYATLSHCWGRDEFLTLNEENMDEFMAGIPLERLPKSFQDAILICKRLEIKYLWIDSLCIIQGKQKEDEDWQAYSKTLAYKDWEEHARTMADIYKNCLLNISIDRASNPFEGAFAERPPGVVDAGLALVRRHGKRSAYPLEMLSDSSRRNEPVYCAIFGPSDDIKCIDRMPLSRRAWVFQERYMSPRVLHFGTDRIYWECRQKSRGEGSPLDDNSVSESLIFGKGFRTLHESSLGMNDLLRNYSARSLTKPRTDKLVAFAAVAREIEERRNDKYVVGLFQSELPYSLLWVVNSKRYECTRPKDQAPSWSWASVNSERGGSYIYPCEGAVSEILEIDLRYVDEKNSYGMVSSGTLRIKGRMGLFLWNGEEHYTGFDKGVLVTDHAGTPFEQREMLLYFDTEDDRVSHMGRECHFLLITSRLGEGLILTETETKGVYKRIGKGEVLVGDCGSEAFEEREIRII